MAITRTPPIVVIFGDESHRKLTALTQVLDQLLPPGIDRSLALTQYDGTRPDDQGGPALAAVLEDLKTLPFLADRRVVVIRDADGFISAHREPLERYLAKPSTTGCLVLECRSFPKTTRLARAADGAGGVLIECKKLAGRALAGYVADEARARGKRVDESAIAQLIELAGQDAGVLASEVEKLALYVGDRPTITPVDVADVVGQTREEKIFAVMDAAAAGRTKDAIRLWHHVLDTDPAAVYKVLGGMAFKVRQWLAAHRAAAEGQPIRSIAPRLMMWGRERDLENLLQRLSPAAMRRLLGRIAELDAQAKSGQRSIETGVEALLVRLAAATR